MSEEIALSTWFSTYGMITTDRILGKYQIKLSSDKALTALKTTHSFYHKLLSVPMKNVLNGIVFQQAHDYHVYAQKLFIDYLLSGENSKDEASQGAGSREELEQERQQLVIVGEEFNNKRTEHYNLIASSQNLLMNISRQFNTALEKAIVALGSRLKKANQTLEKNNIQSALINALIYCDFNKTDSSGPVSLFTDQIKDFLKISLEENLKKQIMKDLSELVDIVVSFDEEVRPFANQIETMAVDANSYRNQFYQAIVHIMELIKLLPEYKIDPEQDLINRESLYFDKSIGAI
jgi:hypothetical protein